MNFRTLNLILIINMKTPFLSTIATIGREKNRKCEFCDMAFETQAKLISHSNEVHMNEISKVNISL